MKAFYCHQHEIPLSSGHSFPLAKYRRLYERVALEADRWGLALRAAQPVDERDLSLAHEADYVRRVATGQLSRLEVRRIGFPWSPHLVERSRHSAGGTLQAATVALAEGIAVNLAGGTHHASSDQGQGYCLFNDVAVAIRVLQDRKLLDRALVIDCDVHQGNGTAAIFAGDPTVFTFSMHGGSNFPFRKVPSCLDLALPVGTGDAQYLDLLRGVITRWLPIRDADCVFYLAGADPYEHDRLGKLKMTKAGLAARDRLVLEHCRSLGVPVAVVMAGGYASDIEDIVSIHASTVREAASDWQHRNGGGAASLEGVLSCDLP